jgi:hypothetical protein
MAFAQKAFYQMPTDKPGSTRDENMQRRVVYHDVVKSWKPLPPEIVGYVFKLFGKEIFSMSPVEHTPAKKRLSVKGFHGFGGLEMEVALALPEGGFVECSHVNSRQ